MTKTAALDLLTRLLWTLVQAGLGLLVVEAADWDYWWAVPIAAALSGAKSWVASRVGDRNTVTFS